MSPKKWFTFWLGGWKNSLKFKMGNFRTKMRKLGVPDVTVNAGKHGANNPEAGLSRKNKETQEI